MCYKLQQAQGTQDQSGAGPAPHNPRQERGLSSLPLFSSAFHSLQQKAKLPAWAPFRLTARSPQRIHALSPRRSPTLGAPSFPRNVCQPQLESSDRPSTPPLR